MSAPSIVKPAKFKLDLKKQETTSPCDEKEGSREGTDHDYAAMDVAVMSKRERSIDSVPSTPSKKPAEKKAKSAEISESDEVSNATILKAILNLEKRVDEQLADLSVQCKQASTMLASLAKAVQFNSEEVKECKQKVKELERRNEQLTKDNYDLKERVREQERYKMRWCLRIKGLEEKKDEDVRSLVVGIPGKIAPDMTSKLEESVDVVHRVGKKIENKVRHIIILFALRHVKEEIWRRTKDSAVCKNGGFHFAEVLPREDWEERRRLWPQIEQARRAGKRAFFRGPHGYIEGRRIGDVE